MNTLFRYINIWFKAARGPFLIMSIIPSILGGILAYKDGFFNWTFFLLATIGIILAHSAADFFDDYIDYKNGNVGNKEKKIQTNPLLRGEVTHRQVLWATIICSILALIIGIYLFVIIGAPVLYLTVAGAFIIFFYTSRPFKLNYHGFGETAMFLAFGPMIVFGIYYVLTRQYSWEPILLSIPIGIFTMNVGLISNIFDYNNDLEDDKHTIPVQFGRKNAITLLRIVSLIGFLVIIICVIAELIAPFSLSIIILSLFSINVLRNASHFNEVHRYKIAMKNAITLSALCGILLIISYIIEITI